MKGEFKVATEDGDEAQDEVEVTSEVPGAHCDPKASGVEGGLLLEPCPFAGTSPLAWQRVSDHAQVKKALSDTLAKKWGEATDGPPHALTEVLSGQDGKFRPKLIEAQGRCPELAPLIEAWHKVLGAKSKEPTAEAEALSKDYRLHPVDGLLESGVSLQS